MSLEVLPVKHCTYILVCNRDRMQWYLDDVLLLLMSTGP